MERLNRGGSRAPGPTLLNIILRAFRDRLDVIGSKLNDIHNHFIAIASLQVFLSENNVFFIANFRHERTKSDDFRGDLYFKTTCQLSNRRIRD